MHCSFKTNFRITDVTTKRESASPSMFSVQITDGKTEPLIYVMDRERQSIPKFIFW
ncbi:hypothetical protein EWM64_g4814 [Hericium alpestre]|uniref:Uncharacterized protein n=1 Tax=Hericium alpestre TaxID=135208 RepID=A0A4Y9ZYS2_9AGAM|nr:hypothetical protein EWM64_g4814 [Hericium alpestre]